MGTHPSIRRTYPLGEALVIDRTIAWDASRGVHLLHARRRAAQPTSEQIAVHQRLQQLRDAIERGEPEPIVRWSREGLVGRLIRIKRRLDTRLAAAKAAAAGGNDILSLDPSSEAPAGA